MSKIWTKSLSELDQIKHLSILAYDSAWISILKQLMKVGLDGYRCKLMMPNEVTIAWFNDKGQSLTLFPEKTLWIVQQAEKIPKDVVEWISKNFTGYFSNQTDNYFWFCMEGKPKHDKWKKIELEYWELSKVMPWEEKALVVWLGSLFQLDAKKIHQFWPWGNALELHQHFQLLEMLSLELLTWEEVATFYSKGFEEGEKFTLLESLHQQDLTRFWLQFKTQNEGEPSTEIVRTIQFIKSHVLKMLYAKESKSFNPKNNFEKKMYAAALKWDKRELMQLVKLCSDWEIISKSRRSLDFVWSQEYVRTSRGS